MEGRVEVQCARNFRDVFKTAKDLSTGSAQTPPPKSKGPSEGRWGRSATVGQLWGEPNRTESLLAFATIVQDR
jgi:hypothetical protein